MVMHSESWVSKSNSSTNKINGELVISKIPQQCTAHYSKSFYSILYEKLLQHTKNDQNKTSGFLIYLLCLNPCSRSRINKLLPGSMLCLHSVLFFKTLWLLFKKSLWPSQAALHLQQFIIFVNSISIYITEIMMFQFGMQWIDFVTEFFLRTLDQSFTTDAHAIWYKRVSCIFFQNLPFSFMSK